MEACILRCRPGSQFHFGKMALDANAALHDTSDRFHSDTLFSAIINIAASITNNPKDIEHICELFRTGKIQVSSGSFCLSHGDEDIFLLPKPEHFLLRTLVKDIKKIARIEFISKRLWEEGFVPDEKEWVQNVKVLNGKFAVLKSEVKLWNLDYKNIQIHSIETLPKVYVRSIDQENAFYFQSNVVMPDNPTDSFQLHYYFLLNASEEAKKEAAFGLVNTAIQLLPETGIGGERNNGCGQFLDLEIKDFALNTFPDDGSITLGLTSPADHDDLDAFIFYKTLFRGGRKTAEDGQLQRIRMMAEGALIKEPVRGNIYDIKNKAHSGTSYLRYGVPLCLQAHKNTLPKD